MKSATDRFVETILEQADKLGVRKELLEKLLYEKEIAVTALNNFKCECEHALIKHTPLGCSSHINIHFSERCNCRVTYADLAKQAPPLPDWCRPWISGHSAG